jgi:hypothetical protein
MAKINLFQSFCASKILLSVASVLMFTPVGLCQHSDQAKKEKGKPVRYNGVGLDVMQVNKLIVGGNHIAFRKTGFGISWRVNFTDVSEGFKGQNHEISIENAYQNNWQTGKQKEIYLGNINLNYAIAISKKIPFYFGVGVANRIILSEFQPPILGQNEKIWIEEKSYQNIKLNVGCGIFVPLYNSVILNVGYDYRPQTLFVGIAISGPFNYEDLDMW